MHATSTTNDSSLLGDTLSVNQAYAAMRENNAMLVDVRNPGEFAAEHPTDAINIPLTELAGRAHELPKDRPLLLSCQSGQRSQMAFHQLRSLGLQNTSNVAGGFSAWDKANLPVVRGQGAIPLERQVRIAAGALVFLFSLAGFLLNHSFFYGALFIGFMLAFTGILGICPMMSLLALMPWNRRRQ